MALSGDHNPMQERLNGSGTIRRGRSERGSGGVGREAREDAFSGHRLVGRARELAALGRLADGFERSDGGWAQIVGEPGIGKSTLLNAVGDRADRLGCLVLSGGGAELERDVPYGVFVGALDDYLGALVDRPVLGDLGGETLGVLGRVFPALSASREVKAPGGDQRYQIHRALRGLLGRLATSRPTVLLLDDLHWADAASLEAIVHLVRHPPAAPVLLVLAWRTGQAPELEGALSDAGRGRPGRVPGLEVELEPLSEEEVGELLGPAVGRERRALVYRESGGNPFYAQQLVGADTSAEVEPPGRRAGDVPGPVLAAVRGEIERLSSAAGRFVRGAAVAGDPFGLELAAACGELDDQQALGAIDELVACGVVHATASPRRFAFRHPLVRRAVYDWSGSGWRLGAHGRAAQALARWGSPIALRAHHVALSARHGDVGAAALLARAAVQVQGHSPASAAEWSAAALAILPEAAEHAALRFELLLTIAGVRGALGELDGAHSVLLDALELIGEEDPRRIALLSEIVRVEHLLGRWVQARARLLGSLERLDEARVPDRVAVQLELALSALFWLDFTAAADRAEQAARLAEGVDAPLYAAATALQAFVAACSEQIAAARPLAERAAQTFDALSDEQLARRLDAAYYLGRAEYVLEAFVASERHLRRGIEVAQTTGGSSHLMNLMVEHARALMVCGRLDAAGEVADLAVGTLRLSGQGWALGLALSAKLSVLSAAGEHDAALEVGREAVALIEATAAGELALSIRRQLALVELEAGRPEQFLAELGAVGTPEDGLVDPGTRCLLYEALVRAEIACGHLEAARCWAQLAERAASDLELDLTSALACRARARLLLADDDPRSAVVKARAAATLATGAGARIEAARSRALVGEALAQSGDRGEAIVELRAAAEQLGECGAHIDHNRVVRRLRRLGMRMPTHASGGRVRAGMQGLSAREREVAELVALGLSNRQIAEALYLSPRTVETHLAHVCSKLGVTGRAAVAAAVERSRAAPDSAQDQGPVQGSAG
jgi:DNA-binding CsgD family transcriptional regulator